MWTETERGREKTTHVSPGRCRPAQIGRYRGSGNSGGGWRETVLCKRGEGRELERMEYASYSRIWLAEFWGRLMLGIGMLLNVLSYSRPTRESNSCHFSPMSAKRELQRWSSLGLLGGETRLDLRSLLSPALASFSLSFPQVSTFRVSCDSGVRSPGG